MITTTSSDPIVREWDQLRSSFASSIMVETALSSLAQNLDGLEWPIGGPDETPALYIDLSFDELTADLASRGHAGLAPTLIRILRETLAFDQPFGEMVAQVGHAEPAGRDLLRNLASLGLPADFPIELVRLDQTARDLCRLEQVRTLGQFAAFAQGLSQNIIVGGDLKRLLNALSHVDEATLAELLPFRRGSKGVHLAEALAHASIARDPLFALRRTLVWFKVELAAWQQAVGRDSRFLLRELALLRDPQAEARAAALIEPHLHAHRSRWSRFLSRFKR